METLYAIVKQQYAYVTSSRESLFDYCQTIAQTDFIRETDDMGRGGSIRNLLVHIANTYRGWILISALDEDSSYTSNEQCTSIIDVKILFEEVNQFMNRFFENVILLGVKHIDMELDGQPASVEALKMFTHVITHEFHHKGQVLTRSRQLGYTPVDTDVMR